MKELKQEQSREIADGTLGTDAPLSESEREETKSRGKQLSHYTETSAAETGESARHERRGNNDGPNYKKQN